MVGITTDSALEMIGQKAGLTILVVQKEAESGGKVVKYLHQEQLCAMQYL